MVGRTVKTLVVACIAAFVLASGPGTAEAGESRIPLRIEKVKEGDWVFYRENEEYVKETAVELEKLEEDYIVHYVMEKYAPTGEVVSKEEVARFLSGERAELAEVERESAKIERRRGKLDGKNVVVYVAIYPGEVPYEMWFSDDIGITGRVAMVVKLPSENEKGTQDFKPIETLGFGSVRNNFDFKRYVK